MKNENLLPKVRFKGFSDPWEQRKLGEMYYFKNGLNKGKEFFGFGTPIVNFVDVFHNRGLYAQNLNGRVNLTEKEINNFRVHKGDIFFTRTSETIEEIGFPSVMLSEPQDTVFSGFVLRGRSLEKPGQLVNIFKKYVFFTNAFRKEMVTKSSMTTRALTSGTALSAMRVKFPLEATEQKKIGELITRLDYLIAANEDKLEQLKTLKKLMMQKIFSQKWRFKGFTDPWEQRKWADLIDISTDMVDPRDVEFSELPHVGPGNIEAFSGQLLDNVNTVEKDHLISGKFHFYKGNIIYGKINPQLAKYIWADFEGLSSADTYVLTTKSANILNQGFIFYLLQTRNFYKYSVSVSMRTGMPKINRSELDAYSFLCPQSPEQIKIVQTIKILDDLIAANEDKLNQLKKLKKYLMQNMFV